MTTQDKTRSAFEAHAKRNGLCIDRAPCQRGVSEKYWSAQTQHTWEGWTAASKQQSSQAQQDALDAARYRIARRQVGFYRTDDGRGPVSAYLLMNVPAGDAIASETDASLDAIAAQGASNV